MLLIWWTHPALGVRLQLLLIRSHSTRQSFMSSALASPPILRYYRHFPSNARNQSAGVSLPSRMVRRKEKPHTAGVYIWTFAYVCHRTQPSIRKLFVDPMCMGLWVVIIHSRPSKV